MYLCMRIMMVAAGQINNLCRCTLCTDRHTERQKFSDSRCEVNQQQQQSH